MLPLTTTNPTDQRKQKGRVEERYKAQQVRYTTVCLCWIRAKQLDLWILLTHSPLYREQTHEVRNIGITRCT